jgi:hypothetical protein
VEIVEGGLGIGETQLHQTTAGIVDVDQQRALRTAVLEPSVLRTVDLDQFTETVSTVARLMHALAPLPTILPDARFTEPLANRLA